MSDFELNILNFIQENLRFAFADFLMPLITSLGDAGIFWILLTVVLLLIPKFRTAGAAMGTALLLSLIVCNLTLKPLFSRIRPFDINTAITLLIEPPSDFSFPSGHTSASFAAASSLLFMKKRLCIPMLILAALIAFSRLYLYVHYPSDVFVSLLLGVAFGFLGAVITKKLISKYHSKLSDKKI